MINKNTVAASIFTNLINSKLVSVLSSKYFKQYLTMIVAHFSLGNPKLPPERQGTARLLIL